MLNQSPRIVTLTHEFYPRHGGIATYTQEMALALSNAGHEVEVWAPNHPRLFERRWPYTVRALPVRGTQGWPCRINLARFLRRNRHLWEDAVLYIPEPGPLRTWMYLQMLGIQPPRGLVVTLHGSEIERFSRLFYRRHLFASLLEKADRIGVVSNFGKRQLLQYFPETAERVVVAHGALRTDFRALVDLNGSFSPRPVNGHVNLLTVGRVHPRKGQAAVVEALALLPRDLRARIKYNLVGPVTRPSYLRQIQALARRHGVQLKVHADVDDQDLRKHYETADIFVMTSQPHGPSVEGFGLTYLEASAHGLPVVAHRTGGVADAVKHGETGLKAHPEDRAGLAHALRRLTENAELRHRLGSKGRIWASSFSWDFAAGLLFDKPRQPALNGAPTTPTRAPMIVRSPS